MQGVDKELLKQLIAEGKAAGKDVSNLESSLNVLAEAHTVKAKEGEKKVVRKTECGKLMIESTGPAREDDFE